MKVLLAGATGLVGQHALAQLITDTRCDQVIAPTRRPLDMAHPKVVNPVVDFAALPADAAWWQVDGAICALGTTMAQAGSKAAFVQVDHAFPMAVAQAVHTAGARVFALNSAAGASVRSPLFYSRVKGELERDLQRLGFASLTLVRPGLIGGTRSSPRRGEELAARVLGALHPCLPRAWRINPAPRIASALVGAVLAPQPGCRVIGAAQLS